MRPGSAALVAGHEHLVVKHAVAVPGVGNTQPLRSAASAGDEPEQPLEIADDRHEVTAAAAPALAGTRGASAVDQRFHCRKGKRARRHGKKTTYPRQGFV